jgi:hypothetical protein
VLLDIPPLPLGACMPAMPLPDVLVMPPVPVPDCDGVLGAAPPLPVPTLLPPLPALGCMPSSCFFVSLHAASKRVANTPTGTRHSLSVSRRMMM